MLGDGFDLAPEGVHPQEIRDAEAPVVGEVVDSVADDGIFQLGDAVLVPGSTVVKVVCKPQFLVRHAGMQVRPVVSVGVHGNEVRQADFFLKGIQDAEHGVDVGAVEVVILQAEHIGAAVTIVFDDAFNLDVVVKIGVHGCIQQAAADFPSSLVHLVRQVFKAGIQLLEALDFGWALVEEKELVHEVLTLAHKGFHLGHLRRFVRPFIAVERSEGVAGDGFFAVLANDSSVSHCFRCLFPPVAGFVKSYRVIETLHLADVEFPSVEFLAQGGRGIEVIINLSLVYEASDIANIHLLDLLVWNGPAILLNMMEQIQAYVQPHLSVKVTIFVGNPGMGEIGAHAYQFLPLQGIEILPAVLRGVGGHVGEFLYLRVQMVHTPFVELLDVIVLRPVIGGLIPTGLFLFFGSELSDTFPGSYNTTAAHEMEIDGEPLLKFFITLDNSCKSSEVLPPFVPAFFGDVFIPDLGQGFVPLGLLAAIQ